MKRWVLIIIGQNIIIIIILYWTQEALNRDWGVFLLKLQNRIIVRREAWGVPVSVAIAISVAGHTMRRAWSILSSQPLP